MFTFLAILLFGVAEAGFLFHDEYGASNATRAAARYLGAGGADGAGDTTTQQVAAAAAPSLLAANLTVTPYYSIDGGTTWTAFSTGSSNNTDLANGQNVAPPGSLIKVCTAYNHTYLTGFMTGRSTTINVVVAMKRQQ